MFTEPTRGGAYDAKIYDDTTAVVRARSEAAHKANRAYHATYEMVRRETTKFILDVLPDTWVREFRDSDLLYTEFAPK